MANIKFIAVSRSLSGILDYVTNREKTVERLISGVNCVAQTAQDEFEAVKKQFHKTDGRSYYHIVQAFAPDDPLEFDTAHEIGLKFAEYFKGYQCVVVTHMNTAHIHNHIIMNSVNFETGQKFHQSAREMQQAKEYSNQLCREYGLSFTESKADPFRIPAWKKRLCRTIKEAMENCATREEFIAFMAEYGYKVRWEPNQKYITYTTPENIRCRDNKLFDQTLLRSSMEAYFDMGGCEYLESRIDATEYGELLPTVDDAVCGLISILDAMNTGDNNRFHLETLHHSKQEIRRILERGGNRKQPTPPEGNPRRGGFSLSVGKYVVKGVRRKKECLDLCCKYTCLRHIWQYAEGIIHRNLGCAQLRWQNQRIRKIPLKSMISEGFWSE